MLSALAQRYAADPGRTGSFPEATHQGAQGIEGEGPYVLLWFQLNSDGLIVGASHQTNGCPSIIACASLACRLLTGRSLEQALLLTPQDIALILGGLPEGKGDCPERVVKAIRSAFGENQ